jgi:hypothetical protein
MPITSSAILVDHAQEDSRRRIWELHRDHLSVSHLVSYLAEADDDLTINLTINAAKIEEQLAAQELAANLQEVLSDEI